MKLTNVKKGDTLFIVYFGNRSAMQRPAAVLSAGPKYVTVEGGYRGEKFHRESGYVVTDYSPYARAYLTQQEYLDEQFRESLERQVRTVDWRVVKALSLDDLKDIAAILAKGL